MQYGMPYMGSKSKIAEWIIDILPEGKVLVDAFGGGNARHQPCVMAKRATKIAGGGEKGAGYLTGVIEEGHFLESVDDHGGVLSGGI